MRYVVLHSNLSETDIKNVHRILEEKESLTPNESFKNSFPSYKGMITDGKTDVYKFDGDTKIISGDY